MALLEREMIRSDADLASLCEELKAAGRFALDTEFAGERTYVPRLCLVQVATTEFIALVDTIVVKNLAPLWALVADPDITVVLHAAREDLRLAYYGGGRLIPQGIFDTQVAAGLIGLPQYPLSYAKLVEAVAGVKLDKSETRSEWDRRPLSPEQIRYACDDVRYLLPIQDRIMGVMERLGRVTWMQEEMARFSEAATYESAPEFAYLRLRVPRGGLSARAAALLRGVTAWREREAAFRDVPARTLLRDEVLFELAQRPPRRLTDFRRLRGFPEGEDVSLGPPLLEALDAARALPPEQLPPAMTTGPEDATPAQRAIADVLYALGETLCLTRDLAPELALSRADVHALARGEAAGTLAAGWRKSALGDDLQRIASGAATAQFTITPDGPRVTFS